MLLFYCGINSYPLFLQNVCGESRPPFFKILYQAFSVDICERLFYNESEQELAFDFKRKGDTDGPVYLRRLK